MYKLLNKLFGWDYIHWSNCVARGIARVHIDAIGNPYYWRYKSTLVLDKINKYYDVVWLTCRPEKYLVELDYSRKIL